MKAGTVRKKRKPTGATKTIQVRRGKPQSRPMLSRSRGDRVKWKNNDKLRQRIVLSKWPFEGKRRAITVAGGKLSVPLKVRSSARKGKVRYAIVTKEVFPKRRGRVGPDPPGFSVGG
jgi:hypothetical protein